MEPALVMQVVNAVLTFLTLSLGTIIGYLTLKLQAQKVVVKDLEDREHGTVKLCNEAIDTATEVTNTLRRERGEPPIIPLKAVVPQSNSPATLKQRREAGLATQVARLTAVRLAAGLEALPKAEEEQP